MICRLAVLACLSLASLQSPAQSTNPAPVTSPARAEAGPPWAALTVSQQTALAPLRAHWPTIDASRKAKWLVVAQRFPSMPDAERERVKARMAEWASMTPAERGRARQNFQELRKLPADDRQAMWEAYRALPENERRELAQRAKTVVKPAETPPTSEGKPRVAVNQAPVTVKPVSPTLVQAKPGATTTLVTKTPTPPVHHQPGLPKITASKGFVDPATLLPNRGPQGAAAHVAAGSASRATP